MRIGGLPRGTWNSTKIDLRTCILRDVDLRVGYKFENTPKTYQRTRLSRVSVSSPMPIPWAAELGLAAAKHQIQAANG